MTLPAGLSATRTCRLIAGLLAAVPVAVLVSQFDLISLRRPFSSDIEQGLEGTYYTAAPAIIAPFVLLPPPGGNGVRLAIDGRLVDCGLNWPAVRTPSCVYTSGHVYFATPDGRDPRADGRTYELQHPVRLHPYLGLMALLIAVLLWRLSIAPRDRRLRALRTSLAYGGITAGVALMAINVAGQFTELRIAAPAGSDNHGRDGLWSYDEALRQLAFGATDTARSYGHRATSAIAQSVLHGWDHGLVQVPLRENWLLHVLGLAHQNLHEYRFWDHRKDLERGIGMCGHISSMLIGFLRENGIDARMVGLNGHMVATAEVAPGEWHVLDPYYDVVIPHSLSTLEHSPDLVRSHYEPAVVRVAGSASAQAALDQLVAFYTTPKDNQIDPSGRMGFFSGRMHALRERLLYILKWAVPPVLLLLGALLLWLPRPGAAFTRTRAAPAVS